MFALGLILILLSAGALVAVLANGTGDQAEIFGGHLPTLVVFLTGAAALLLFIMGLELVRSGLKHANVNRRNKRKLRKLEKQDAPAGATGTGAGTGAGTGVDPAPHTGSSDGGPHETPPPAR